MIQPIYLYGSEVLRARAAEADLSKRDELTQLIVDLKDTLERSEGCGLAAPQIGVSLRVLIVDGDVMQDVYPYLKGFRRTIINPEVLEESPEQIEYEEGCLSIPGVYCSVRRPSSVKLRYWGEDFQEHVETFDKFAARMVQHEMSHLDGVLFTDLVAPIRRKMIAKKLVGISHGKVATRYNSKVK